MYRKYVLRLPLIIILLVVLFSLQSTAAGQTTVDNFPIPGPGDTSGADGTTVDNFPIPGPRDSSGADGTITFWQLPLWIQITQITWIATVTVAALAVILGLLPLIAGKLKNLRDNETRDRIYAYVKKNPGSTVADVARQEGLNLGTVRYHVSQLQITHKISLVRSSKFVRLFQNSGAYSERERAIISAMSRSTALPVVMYIKEAPGATNTEISDHLHISGSGAHMQLKKLLREGVLRAEPAGRFLKYYLRDDVEALIDKQSIA